MIDLITLILSMISIIVVLIILRIMVRKDSANSVQKLFSDNFDKIIGVLKDDFARSREEINLTAKQTREELNNSFKLLSDTFFNRMMEIANIQKSQLESFRDNLLSFSKLQEEKMEMFRNGMDNRLQAFQNDLNNSLKSSREELSNSSKSLTDTLIRQLAETSLLQKKELNTFSEQLTKLTQSNEQKLELLKDKIEERLKTLQENNAQKLEEMRIVVDEKLQNTLEKRLGESFKLVSERLELVHKGLGEMQNLANGVGDLKKVLSNIKTRGTWGEVQLGSLIEQILTPEQYAKNISTKYDSTDRVEYAIKMPGRGSVKEEILWLPIDAKFPLEDYQRLIDAQETGNLPIVEDAGKALENRIKLEAKSICEKYLDPPHTTDFAIMFLPIEGLFAEVLRRPGLSDKIQREFRIVLAGPTTLTAILNSLQMGFRTLAIEKRSSEVWKLLGAVKTDFGTFGDLLDKTKKKLQEASNTIDTASTASRRIERKLKNVQALPKEEEFQFIEEKKENIQE